LRKCEVAYLDDMGTRLPRDLLPGIDKLHASARSGAIMFLS
jgi:hypothetical protein